MYQRIAPIAAGLLTVGLVVAGCGNGNDYSAKTDHCAAALAQRASGDKSKPKECEGVTKDDYDLLNGDAIMHSMGIIDGNGNVDMDKLVSPTDTP